MNFLVNAALLLSACGGEGDKTQARGPDPKLPEQQSSLLPSMKIAEPAPWGEQKPRVPDGLALATGFRGDDGKSRGRPVGVTVDPKGALIIADDLANTVWRVTRNR